MYLQGVQMLYLITLLLYIFVTFWKTRKSDFFWYVSNESTCKYEKGEKCVQKAEIKWSERENVRNYSSEVLMEGDSPSKQQSSSIFIAPKSSHF